MAGRAENRAFWIEPLRPHHDRASFSCGVDSLDLYLRNQAGQDFKNHAAVSFVFTPDGREIAGYYTLSQYAVQLANVPPHIAKKLPKYPMVPTTLIGRLAVSAAFRGQGHGETLLMDALYRILQHSKELAFAGAIVDAIDDAAIAFYKKYGFLELPNVPRRLFLPMGTIEALFK
ncbi:MAG: GNAT family N-acetyltransferase [Candidatus Acidiferrum sp.]